jgi:misacylated tRNA(Ala) deacylase
MATEKLYWKHDHCLEADAQVVAVRDNRIAFDRTCFYPGGGGQPCDLGLADFGDGVVLSIASVSADAEGVIWHVTDGAVDESLTGRSAHLSIDGTRRTALARYHTVLHILNTLALRLYGAWITGAQIATDYARIDFKWDGFSSAYCAELEARVNEVIAANHFIAASFLSAEEFSQRPDVLRTLEVSPPVIDDRVRVVAIQGFDEQACGGTHMHGTGELGHFSIYRTENKGKINKRLYVRLAE